MERQVTPETDRGIASLKHHKTKGDQDGKKAIWKPCEHVWAEEAQRFRHTHMGESRILKRLGIRI